MRKTFIKARQTIKKVVILVLFCCLAVLSLFLCSCTQIARVYPIEGPLAQQNVGVLYAKFLYNGSGSGWIEITFPDGEICKGEYTTLVDGVSSFGSGSIFNSNTWANCYGSYYATSNTHRGTATLIGNKGTVVQLEYFVSLGTARGYGLGKDNKGNIFKVHF